MNSDDDAADREMLLAEFSVLRAEILQRTSMQWNIFAWQLTASGVVFSFALSSPSHAIILLILSVITYALTGRYVSQYFGVQNARAYIREVLEVRAKGKLQWEAWIGVQPPKVRALTWLNPLLIAFPGPASIALTSVAPYVWTGHNTPVGKRVLLVIIWLVGVLITALSIRLITRIMSRHWNRSWRQRLNELPVVNKSGAASSSETRPSKGNGGDPNPPTGQKVGGEVLSRAKTVP
jgi:hypothetical protein